MNEEKIVELTVQAEKWRSECINLIASENVMSPLARRAYNSDFMHRYAEGQPFQRYYQGTKFIDEIESDCMKLACELFKCKFSDVQAISGCLANLAVFSAFGKPGDVLMSAGASAGAHISHERFGAAGIRGISTDNLVFDADKYDVDVDASKRKIREKKPKIIVLGGSAMLFPHPVKELSEVAREEKARIIYDAAHVLGLVAGGVFQDPLREGAEVITASTHKTFPGPQGAIILANTSEEDFNRIQVKLFPGLLSNHHLHRLPALAITLLEMKKFGREYARQTVKNAQTLASALHAEGFDVLGAKRGYTSTHQVLIDVRKIGDSSKVVGDLEKANIICNKNMLAWDELHSTRSPSGIRLGVQEMTRFGMKEKEMNEIACVIADVAIRKKKPENVKKEAIELRKKFQKIHFTF